MSDGLLLDAVSAPCPTIQSECRYSPDESRRPLADLLTGRGLPSHGEGDGCSVEHYVEELFLGTAVYPQEQGELQLTGGVFTGVETQGDWRIPFEVEYGLTDRLQIGLDVPTDLTWGEGAFRGVGNVGVGVYYNFYNDGRTGRACGVGFDWGVPVDAPDEESTAHVYEPYFVLYQDWHGLAVNFSANLEITDPRDPDEATQTGGDLVLAAIRPCGRWTQLLEAEVNVAPDGTTVRLAPGLYGHHVVGPVDVGVALPIGLSDNTPDVGVYLLAIIEFEPGAGRGFGLTAGADSD